MTVKTVRIGDVLELRREPVTINPDSEYRRIGIYSWGKGFLHRPASPGTDMGSLRYFTFPEAALVLSNIQAWEAAIAVSGVAEREHVASNRFLPYVPIDESRVDVDYLMHYFLSEDGLGALRRASPGTQVRNRTLGKKLFESIRVPLPELPEQHRLAAHLGRIDRLRPRVPTDANQAISTLDRSESDFLESLEPMVPISRIATVNPPPDRIAMDSEIVFVPMEAVDQRGGTIASPRIRRREDLASGYKQFRPGDVIFARITPCMQNGKCAIYADTVDRPAYGSTEFHVLRSENPTDREWIHAVLRTRWFRDRAMESFVGTAGQQRVPASFLRAAPVPYPCADVRGQALIQLNNAEMTRRYLRDAVSRRSQLVSSLLPAARNEVFSALR